MILMKKIDASGGNTTYGKEYFYQIETSLTTPSTSDSILVAPFLQIAVGFFPVSLDGKGYVEYTCDTIDRVNAGTAEWLKWADGDVLDVRFNEVQSCVALRLVSLIGSVRMVVTTCEKV